MYKLTVRIPQEPRVVKAVSRALKLRTERAVLVGAKGGPFPPADGLANIQA